MSKFKMLFLMLLIVLVLIVGCKREEAWPETVMPVLEVESTEEVVAEATAVSLSPTPAPASDTDAGLVISEVLLGLPGSNQEEFIELYNAGHDPVDLAGYTLVYRLKDDKDENVVFAWTEHAEIPGLGHWLLVREGCDFGLTADGRFDQTLSEKKGGLILRDADGGDVDLLGWGEESPTGYFVGSPAAALSDGSSLERLPGGAAGNATVSGDNAADFVAAVPNPQNSGSDQTPLPDERLAIHLTMPETVPPLTEFDMTVMVENLTGQDVADVVISVPVLAEYEMVALPDGAAGADHRYQYTVPHLATDETHELSFTLRAPLSYIDTVVAGYYAEAAGFLRAYGSPLLLSVAGGTVPVDVARESVGNTVTVEGVATMYTDGFYAGGTGTKFYMEDETGGIQVYIPGGKGAVRVNIGDEVRVTGEIELYRDSIELVPANVPADIEITHAGAAAPEPTLITVQDNNRNDAVIGRLNAIEGTVTRIEEFTYSYEVDLTDDEGYTALVYMEKEAGLTAEPLDVGRDYRITGISEFYDSFRQLKPRWQEDIVEIFPPILRMELAVANSIEAGELLTYTLTVNNYTAAPMTNLVITAVPPTNAALTNILNDGQLTRGQIQWQMAELAGNGGETAVQFVVQVEDGQTVEFPAATASADQWPQPAMTQPFLTFVGSGVPIWVIQGSGDTSPYVRTTVTTEGVVTAVFPELGGFWLQELVTDDDPATSAGIFVFTDMIPDGLAAGDQIQLTGRVREASGQTLIQPPEPVTIITSSTGNPLPEPVPYNPPADPVEAAAYNEALEGMLVALEGSALVIAPTTKYGETAMVAESWGVDTVTRLDEVGYIIMADDGSSMTHEDGSTQPYAAARGDRISGLVGPLAYTFENYKIEPIDMPQIVAGQRLLTPIPEPGSDEITIATFNAENFFDNRDPHPSSPPKPGKTAYANKLNKVAEAILAMGAPTIVGLQEVENIGVLEDLVALPNLATYQYQPILIEGTDARGIDVAYLVRGDQAVIEGAAAYPAPEGLSSRPPLVITTTVNLASHPETIYVLNNHFTSLSAGEKATEPRRTAQAAWNVTLVQQILAADPDAQIVVLGDLNSFYHTLPIDTLENAGLAHAYDIFGEDETLPYTYIYQGRTQSLDHILMTQNLFDRLGSVDTVHINVDYPLPLPDDDSPHRVSDHDPVVVRFSFSH